MRIGEPAREHGVPDEDIEHAVRNAIRQHIDDDEFAILIGPARDGALDLEGEDPVVIHAMPARPKFLSGGGRPNDQAHRYRDLRGRRAVRSVGR
jgi:hypothetical protein